MSIDQQHDRRRTVIGSVLAVAVLAALLLAAPGGAAQSAPSVATFPVIADTFVDAEAAADSFGTRWELRTDADPVTRALVKFDVAGGGDAPITGATLRVFNRSGNAEGWSVRAISNRWSEESSYSDSPGPGRLLGASGPIADGTWTSIDVTEAVQSSGLVSFLLVSESVTRTSIGSREGGMGAQLGVTYGSDPAPDPDPSPPPTADYPQPAAPDGVLRAAFYYPWFPEAWDQKGIEPYTNYTPSIGFYDSGDTDVIAQHIDDMQYAGLQAGIASWWGRGTRTDGRVDALLAGAEKQDFLWSLYYEQEGSADPTVSEISADLDYLSQYTDSTAFLRMDGKPVLFVYADPEDGADMASRWVRANNNRFFLVLKVFRGYRDVVPQPDLWHQYGPAVATDRQDDYSIPPR